MSGLAYLAVAQLLVGTFALSPLAQDPVPADGAEGVTEPFPLVFEAGDKALFHDIYFGLTPELGPENLAFLRMPVAFWPLPWVKWPELEPLTTYYWRVDEIDADGTVHTGSVWSFTTAAWAAYAPSPADDATFVDPDADLAWSADADVVSHDVYFGTDEQAVADGTAETFQGRQEPTTFDPGPLAPLMTYYWRVDEITAAGVVRPGEVRSLTTVDYIVIDDFESYTNEVGQRVFETWHDDLNPVSVPGSPSSALHAVVGHDIWSPDSPHYEGTIVETENVHGGDQAMPLYYDNDLPPYHSEAIRSWDTPQDWTARGMNTLSLWFCGDAANSREPFYAALEDHERWSGVVRHPDPNALVSTEWQQWQIGLTTFSFGPVNPTNVARLYIGIGDRQDPQPGGEGIVYIDDVRLMSCAPLAEPNAAVIDDFESYTNERGQRMFETWIDGCPDDPRFPWDGCTNAAVGHDIWSPDSPHHERTIAETTNVHGGSQAMPLYYYNDTAPHFSETYRGWETTQDWTPYEADTLSLWFRGEAANSAEEFYVASRDETSRIWVAKHPDPNALLTTEWQRWRVPLLTFVRNHVDISAIARLYIGIGDRWDPRPGGTGIVYIDDIELTRDAPSTEPDEPNVVVIDDFESYTNEVAQYMFRTWWDACCPEPLVGAPMNSTGALVGHDIWSPDSPHYQGTIAETEIVHGGNQAMPLYYDNTFVPYYSEIWRYWDPPQDWTASGTDTLSLWLRGEAANSAERFYVATEDRTGGHWEVSHPDPNVLLTTEWQSWRIPLPTLAEDNVDVSTVWLMLIGIGNRSSPAPGGTGLVYIDDIVLTNSKP